VGAATGAPSSAQGFTITVASFRTEQRAGEVAAAVSSLQIPAAVRQDSGGTWYAVVAGPFTSRDSAESAQAVLARNGYGDTRLSAAVPDVRTQPQ
jgi:cell division protein FtsN